MSLLRDVLKNNSASKTPNSSIPSGLSSKSRTLILERKSRKWDTASIKSAGGVTIRSIRSIAESVTSFATTLVGGRRVPKRRRPDVSRLGVPKWYDKNPKEAQEMPGTLRAVYLDGAHNIPYTAAHGYSFVKRSRESDEGTPWMSLIVYNYAREGSLQARYIDESKVRGEVRLQNPENISSIDVWITAVGIDVLNMNSRPFLKMRTRVYERRKPDSESAEFGADQGSTSKGKPVAKKRFNLNFLKSKSDIGDFPPNQVVIFPFEFEPFPNDVQIDRPDSVMSTRVLLPPTFETTELGGFSGNISYTIIVDVKRDGMDVDLELKKSFQYYPVRRPIVQVPTPFPYFSHRDDWPWQREVIGGWTITPFGGRGIYNNEIVEIEGLFGLQSPEVYAPGQTVGYSLLLWSKSISALEALSIPNPDPEKGYLGIDAVLISADTFGTDVLYPRSAAWKNRKETRISQGRIWRTDDGQPESDDMPELRLDRPRYKHTKAATPVPLSTSSENIPTGSSEKKAQKKPRRSALSNPKYVLNALDEEDEENEEDDDIDMEGVSTAPELLPELEEDDGTIRLDGDIRIPPSANVPSFRYEMMGREYFIQVTLSHPDYLHMSPRGPGIYAESPIWVVLGKPAEAEVLESQRSTNTVTASEYKTQPISTNNTDEELSELTVTSVQPVVPVPQDAVRLPLSTGTKTDALYEQTEITTFRVSF
ncbi:hypothetical protein C8Q75DRAFT_806832 [Abortiporus biennis]|nr:hypothetical protein C8Q75DRAFT_806832 [Abortiporus biennis]